MVEVQLSAIRNVKTCQAKRRATSTSPILFNSSISSTMDFTHSPSLTYRLC